MTRIVAAAVLAVLLVPSGAAAQSASFTVTTATADVHKSPSIGSPVIGKAARGRQLAVIRDVGDWLRVSWPDASDGVGYVRQSLGSLSQTGGPAPNGAGMTAASGAPVPQSAIGVRSDVPAAQRSSVPVVRTPSEYVLPPSHRFGVGGLMNGSTIGFGASGRAWSRRRFGVQLELSRFSLTDPSSLGRVNSLLFAPSVIFSLRNHVGDSVWVRPYLGAGAKLSHSTLSDGSAVEVLSENRKSWQVLGGSELTLPNAPRFALSADLRYDSSDVPFAGFEFGGLGFSVAGHWYLK